MLRSVLLAISTVTFSLSNALLHNPPDDKLQCQCTCSPASRPGKTIYTSGNLNIIDKHVHSHKTMSPQMTEITTEQTPEAPVDAPMDAPMDAPTDVSSSTFTDVAVTKVKNSLGMGNAVVGQPDSSISLGVPADKIKWAHSASSVSDMQPMAGFVDSNIDTTGTNETIESAVMKSRDQKIGKIILGKPAQSEIKITTKSENTTPEKILNVVKENIIHDKPKALNVKVKSSLDANNNKGVVDIVQKRKMPVLSKGPSTETDQVAVDIGFVMDGSAPNPILSGVYMSGGPVSAPGSGYYVENIVESSPETVAVDNTNTNIEAVVDNSVASLPNNVNDAQQESIMEPVQESIKPVVESGSQVSTSQQTSNNEGTLGNSIQQQALTQPSQQISEPTSNGNQQPEINIAPPSINVMDKIRNINNPLHVTDGNNGMQGGGGNYRNQERVHNNGNNNLQQQNNNGHTNQQNGNNNGHTNQQNGNNNGHINRQNGNNKGNNNQPRGNNNGPNNQQRENNNRNNHQQGNNNRSNNQQRENNNGHRNTNNIKQQNNNMNQQLNNNNNNRPQQNNNNQKPVQQQQNNNNKNTNQRQNSNWQNNVRNNNNNKNNDLWSQFNLKAFNIQRDQKQQQQQQQRGWNNNNNNNNNQWGSNNWGPTPDPAMASLGFGNIGNVDPLLLFGQHALLKKK